MKKIYLHKVKFIYIKNVNKKLNLIKIYKDEQRNNNPLFPNKKGQSIDLRKQFKRPI